VALILGFVLVVICYFWIDRPVAWFVHDHRFLPRELWRWPPLLSTGLKALAPLAILLTVLWWAWKRGRRLPTTLLAISANVVLTTILKHVLKWTFGRYWPEPWKPGLPSLISDGAYGFHPFHYGPAYDAFPSGHAAIVCAVLSILWLSYPRWRWVYATVGAVVCAALVAMNYHFVSDVIAGVMLGSTTGVCMTCLFRLRNDPALEPQQTNMK
jgi:membrane-associated phospholipid phosphatase